MANPTSYLLLGEGDFTYSLDTCRYLASSLISSASVPSSTIASTTPPPTLLPDDDDDDDDDYDTLSIKDEPSYSITCTGVDTHQELCDKYKDVEFVLRTIRQCCSTVTNASVGGGSILKTAILHGVNAVEAEYDDTSNVINHHHHQQQPRYDTDRVETLHSFDRVLFNHPHLGTEDAQLHSRFLEHFFHAADRRWLRRGASVASTDFANTEEITDKQRVNNTNNDKSQGGLLYLTLVNGQCDRWNCIKGARKHGLVLLRRAPFHPPPAPLSAEPSTSTYYQLRRHQSGKSFANRRRMQQSYENAGCSNDENDSETLVFGRFSDYPLASAEARVGTGTDTHYYDVGLLPWEESTSRKAYEQKKKASEVYSVGKTIEWYASLVKKKQLEKCKYCKKVFQEERSLKNHMLCSHPSCEEVLTFKAGKKSRKKRKATDDGDEGDSQSQQTSSTTDNEDAGPPYICRICISERTFPHKQALLDHQRAKHLGNHVDIKPDWYRASSTSNEHKNNGSFGECPICNLSYSSETEKTRHTMEFVPVPSSTATKGTSNNAAQKQFDCRHCSKSFRDARAQRQHENFCSVRKMDVKE